MDASYSIENETIVLTITEGDSVLSAAAVDIVQMADSIPLETLEEYRALLRADIFEKITELDQDFLDSKIYELYNVFCRVLPNLQQVNIIIDKRTQQAEEQ